MYINGSCYLLAKCCLIHSLNSTGVWENTDHRQCEYVAASRLLWVPECLIITFSVDRHFLT